jgi:hypothetical protein
VVIGAVVGIVVIGTVVGIVVIEAVVLIIVSVVFNLHPRTPVFTIVQYDPSGQLPFMSATQIGILTHEVFPPSTLTGNCPSLQSFLDSVDIIIANKIAEMNFIVNFILVIISLMISIFNYHFLIIKIIIFRMYINHVH